MKKSKGITLIALVITIIILIILAGVGINLTLGDNGIFNKAKLAKEKYNEESIREKVELGIMELEIDELTLGNQITIESALQELLEKETFETIDKDMAIGNIGEHEVKLKYNEQGKIVIEYIAKATGVRVTYKLNPESYTNGEKVGILLTVNGKVKSVTKPDNLIVYPENSTLAINYQVTANGTYKFIIEDEEGNKQEKNVVVDTIDRLPPNDFTITAENIEGGIKIIANTTDAESDGVSVKSGIERYEYFVKGENDTEYTKYETNEIKLEIGNYQVYVIVYDKAGNKITSNSVTIDVEELLHSRRYIDYGIDLDGNGDTTDDWMIFYEEDGTVNPDYEGATYIIPDDYVAYEKMETSMQNAGMSLVEGYNYRVYWSDVPESKEITDEVKKIFMYDYTETTKNNVKAVSRMLDTSAWEYDFVTQQLKEKGGMAIGGATINIWCASWNKEYPTQKIIPTIGKNGYLVNGESAITLSSYMGYKERPNIYYLKRPTNSESVNRYTLASPSSNSNFLLGISRDGKIIVASRYDNTEYGLRPLVYLPSSVKIQESAIPNLYTINYGE